MRLLRVFRYVECIFCVIFSISSQGQVKFLFAESFWCYFEKSQGPMLELSQGKNYHILMDNELNYSLYTKLNTTFDIFRD